MRTIGIVAPTLPAGVKALFDALGDALGVSFERRAFGDDRGLHAWILLQADREAVSRAGRVSLPCYVVLDESELPPRGPSPAIACADRCDLDVVLRGRTITADDAADVRSLPAWLEQVEPLAHKDGAPVWAVANQGRRHVYVSPLPPPLEEGEPLFTQFSSQRLVRLLPLVVFLLRLTEDEGWERPPLQASMMFDDPNLHWPSYGFIDYVEMVKRATAGQYHVSIATIPLDAWFAHRTTVAIFKAHASRISLLYHGNGHAAQELARTSPDAMERLLRQAVERISRMESRTGLHVARVMAPPHGACGETAIAEMARQDFDALCVSRGLLRFHNPRAQWTRTVGMKPCDVIGGLPIIPRFGLSAACHNDVLIAALLRQPIVPITHHQGVADGYALLENVASFANSLGEVRWTGMTAISRSLFARKMEADGTLRIRMFSKRVRVAVPAGVSRFLVERDWIEDGAPESLLWQSSATGGDWTVATPAQAIAVPPGSTIEIASRRFPPVSSRSHAGGTRLASVARRILTEGRDRALPSLQRMSGNERQRRHS